MRSSGTVCRKDDAASRFVSHVHYTALRACVYLMKDGRMLSVHSVTVLDTVAQLGQALCSAATLPSRSKKQSSARNGRKVDLRGDKTLAAYGVTKKSILVLRLCNEDSIRGD